jgi:hypothetical protein
MDIEDFETDAQIPHGILSLLASQPTNLTRVALGLVVTVYAFIRRAHIRRLNRGVLGLWSTYAVASG